ncbi:MAG: hypothetical protein GXP08_12315 [Gammaproteobacteria bacterium]|nr:hypothetical protein [Gammaproteobacteria bacterium]
MIKTPSQALLFLCLAFGFTASSSAANGANGITVVPPEDPTQSITYWKPFTISPQNNSHVANAHQVFSALLRGWDNSRVEPNLYVVRSTAGPWAASLSDGNILLSQQAIEICNSFGKDRSNHLLAFVLAHELAHQRADDLWHQKFFRMVGTQTPELTADIKRKIVSGLNSKTINDLERREAQADNDGLILMSTVGYDPYKIIDKKDFFTAWVENIWQASCANNKSSQNLSACNNAKSRALRTRAQLVNVATQATLFELGTQFFVAGKYPEARRYFQAYGRDYPSRAVHTSIGLSYLAQALEIKRLLIISGTIDGPNFFYPMMLDATPHATPVEEQSNSAKRGAEDTLMLEQKKKISHYIENAINYFEKAIRLEPNHRKTYLYLAMSYLIDNNTFMARGVVQGKFIPKFGHDTSADLLIAMTSATEGKNTEAQAVFDKMLQQINKGLPSTTTIEKELLIYSAFYNYSALLDKMELKSESAALWKRLAKHSKTKGNSILFQLAVNQIQPHSLSKQDQINHPVIQSLRLGDTAPIANSLFKNISKNEIWLEGEQLNIYRFDNGARIVTNPDKKVIGAWQNSGKTSTVGNIRFGDMSDRPLKTFGMPSRHMQMVTGKYLAYDAIGLAIHIVSGKVAGWFLYDPA